MSTEETIFGEQTTMPSVPSIEYGDAVKLTVMKNGRVLGRNGCFRYVLQWKDKDGNVVHEEFQALPPNKYNLPDETSFDLKGIIQHACDNDLFVKVDPDKLEVEEVNI